MPCTGEPEAAIRSALGPGRTAEPGSGPLPHRVAGHQACNVPIGVGSVGRPGASYTMWHLACVVGCPLRTATW